mgnify:CR=1 FL=1
MDNQNIRIRLRGYDNSLLDTSTQDIINTAKRTGAKVKGPIPLPTRRLVGPVRKAPDGEGRETYDHWELRVHKRLLEMDINSGKDESALRQVTKIEIPDTVSIELSMRVVN